MSRFFNVAKVFCIILILSIFLFSGCMTVSDKQTITKETFSSKEIFNNKKIGCLPIKTQTSLSPDSVSGLRNDLNQKIGSSLHNKLASSIVIDVADTSDQMNQRNLLPILEQFFATYENLGVVDKKSVNTIGKTLGYDYLLASRLKAEKLDILISKGFGASLEVILIDVGKGDIVWGGSGEWKKGGIFGFGTASANEASASLLKLAFENL